MMYRSFIFVSMLSLAPIAAMGQTFESGDRLVPLVELYTSEGCSSCPPADRWLASLATHPQLWKSFIPIAFHVDYWDYLGWKDTYSFPGASQRQRHYARVLGDETIFTPAVMRNGAIWKAWRADAIPTSEAKAPRLKLELRDGRWTMEAKGEALGQYPCLMASVSSVRQKSSTKVSAGENKGETLVHGFAALHWTSVKLRKLGTVWQGVGDWDRAKGDAVVAWLSACRSPVPLQAVGGALK